MNVVVYYRTRPQEAAFSDQAFQEQSDAVRHWLEKNPAAVIAEFVEAETDGTSRPRLADAIANCKQSGARLLIARTEPIGRGPPFEPRIQSVSVAIAPTASREIGHVVPSPPDALPGYSLYFPDYRIMRCMPVYLCNSSAHPLEDLQVITAGLTSKRDSQPEDGSPIASQREQPVHASGALKGLPRLPAYSSVVIDHYEPMIDGDEIVSYAISFTVAGTERKQVTALVGPGCLTGRFVKLL
jgi:hypothetical protein